MSEQTIKLTHPDTIFKRGVSPSMVKLWLLCRRRWYNNYIRGLKADAGVYANFGIAYHNFLNTWCAPNGMKPKLEDMLKRFKLDFPEEMSNDKRNQAHGLKLVKAYMDRYPRDTEPFNVLFVEMDREATISVPIEGMSVNLHIKPDMGVLDKHTNGLYLLDNKTTSRLGASYFRKFKNDYQIYVYIKGMSVHLKRRIEGVIINGIGTKAKIDKDSFLRDTIEKSDDQIEYHMVQFAKVANEMVEYVRKNWENVEKFHLSSADFACTAYNVECPYLDMCQFNDNLAFAKEILRRKSGG